MLAQHPCQQEPDAHVDRLGSDRPTDVPRQYRPVSGSRRPPARAGAGAATRSGGSGPAKPSSTDLARRPGRLLLIGSDPDRVMRSCGVRRQGLACSRILATGPRVPVSRGDMPSLMGLRCLAASAVFFAHISSALSETSLASALPWLESIGRTGVALVFVLSGYRLAQPATLRGGVGSYGVRRFARVHPTYLVATAAMVAVGYVQSPSNLPRAGNALLNVSLLQSWAWGAGTPPSTSRHGPSAPRSCSTPSCLSPRRS